MKQLKYASIRHSWYCGIFWRQSMSLTLEYVWHIDGNWWWNFTRKPSCCILMCHFFSNVIASRALWHLNWAVDCRFMACECHHGIEWNNVLFSFYFTVVSQRRVPWGPYHIQRPYKEYPGLSILVLLSSDCSYKKSLVAELFTKVLYSR